MIDRRFKLGMAQFSLLGKSTITAVPRLTTDEFAQIKEDLGIDGYEWHPTKNMTSSHEINNGNIRGNFRESILSAHQSYLGQRTLFDVGKAISQKPGQWPLIVGSYVFLPYSVDSLQNIVTLQEVVGKKLPVVIYPTEDNSSQSSSLNSFGERLFQPTQEVMNIWGVKTIEELLEMYPDKGMDGICLDTTHSRILANIDLRKDLRALKLVLRHTKEIHIRPGALDMQSHYNQKDPLGDLRQLLGNDENAWYPMFIKSISGSWEGGRIITEVQTQALEAFHKETYGKDVAVNLDIILYYHKQITDNLGRYLTSTEV
jgi:hypothetical protein